MTTFEHTVHRGSPGILRAFTFIVAASVVLFGAVACGDPAEPPAESTFDVAVVVDAGSTSPQDVGESPDSMADVGVEDVASDVDPAADTGDPSDIPGVEDVADSTDDVESDADAAGPDVAEPDRADEPVVWFLHISDTHIQGASGYPVNNLRYFFENVVPIVQPVATINTGDLVDDGGESDQWAGYDAITTELALPYPEYFDLIGNHDKKHDGTSSWEAHSITGKAGGGLIGQHFFDTEAGRIRIVRADTSDALMNPTKVLGYFSSGQQEELLEMPVGEPEPAVTLVAAHHPMTGLTALSLLGSGSRMWELIELTGASAYLCGHVHEPDIVDVDDPIQDGVLVVQAGSLGKEGGFSGTTSFMLIVIAGDNIHPLPVYIDTDDSTPIRWPIMQVTRPIVGDNIYTKGLPIPVRAVAFAPDQQVEVFARLAGEEWMALEPDGEGRFAGDLPAHDTVELIDVEFKAVSGDETVTSDVYIKVLP